MIRARDLLVIVAAIGIVSACADHSTSVTTETPVTTATVALVTPHTNDGAVFVTLHGPDIASVRSADPRYVVFTKTMSAQEARVIVLGNVVAGPLLTLSFASPQVPSGYTGTIQEIATRGDSVLASTDGYRVTIAPAQ